MRNNKKAYILLYICLLGMFAPLTPVAIAQDNNYTSIINPSWLYLDVEDSNFDDALKFTQGGVGLTEFKNLGIFSSNPDTNEVIFSGKATFTCQSQIYTTATANKVYENMDTLDYNSYSFLRYTRRIASFEQSHEDYYVTFNNIALGEAYVPTQTDLFNLIFFGTPIPSFDPTKAYNPQYYNIQYPITVGLSPDFESLTGKNINGIEIQGSTYEYEVKRVKVDNIDYGSLGDQNINITIPAASLVSITAVSQKDEPSNSQALKAITTYGLGAQIINSYDTPIQTDIKETTPIGHTWSNQENGLFTFNDRVEIQPQITLQQQKVKRIYAGLDSNDFFGVSYYISTGRTVYTSPDEGTEPLTTAVIVKNHYIWKTYEVEINILSSVQLTAEEYTESLDNPFFIQGDWIWAVDQGGIDNMVLVEQPSIFPDLFGWLGNIFNFIGTIITIIIISIVAIFIFRLIRRRRSRKQNK